MCRPCTRFRVTVGGQAPFSLLRSPDDRSCQASWKVAGVCQWYQDQSHLLVPRILGLMSQRSAMRRYTVLVREPLAVRHAGHPSGRFEYDDPVCPLGDARVLCSKMSARLHQGRVVDYLPESIMEQGGDVRNWG